MATPRTRHAFSLIEIIVVIAILAVLIGILVPVLASGKRTAKRVNCLNNLRSNGMALRSYMDQENRGLLPLLNGYYDQKAEPGDFTAIVPLLARHLDVPAPVQISNKRYEPQSPFVCPLDDEIGPQWGMSYDYYPGALLIDYTTHGRLEPANVVPVTRLYQAGTEYNVLFTDIKPWHDHPTDGRMAAFWDGSAGPLETD